MAATEAGTHPLLKLLKHEAAGGVLLVIAAFLALLFSNSLLAPLYNGFLNVPVSVRIADFKIDKPLQLWINDGLMAIFFFLIGLEIKRELVEGRLSSWKTASLPFFGAIGGMIVPALIYVAFNWGDDVAMRGWAIPAATDIAFAVGVLAILGRHVPVEAKVFLLALAILDDLGAIIVIALFYTAEISALSLTLAAIGISILFAMNRLGVKGVGPYILIGIFVWACVLKSGVHATLAGVITAFMIPITNSEGDRLSPCKKLEHDLHPWVMYGVMPLFAFANAGLDLSGITFEKLLSPVVLGIALGLYLGKQLGIFAFAFLAVKLGISRLPEGIGWGQLYAVSIVAGIGFTMSLFIGSLAFETQELASYVRVGVLAGSILSAVTGYAMFRLLSARADKGGAAPAFSTADPTFSLRSGEDARAH